MNTDKRAIEDTIKKLMDSILSNLLSVLSVFIGGNLFPFIAMI